LNPFYYSHASVPLTALIEPKQLLSAFIGAVFALVGQWLIRRAGKAWTAKRLAVAFWEELTAVSFYGPPQYGPNFGGFSSQTFDTLFRELAESLPETLARALMQYHWRMKYLNEQKSDGTALNQTFWDEAKELHSRLRNRLDHFGRRHVLSLIFRPRETCDKHLLGSTGTGAA